MYYITLILQSYLQDHQGSTSQLVDSLNGSSKARYDYKSYGKLEGNGNNPQVSNPFTYTGREDDGTGLLYYRARYYDPDLEVFISQDPLGDAQQYVGGNPLKLMDPSGKEPISDFFAGGADLITLGATAWTRGKSNKNVWGVTINPCSSAYKTGAAAYLLGSVYTGEAEIIGGFETLGNIGRLLRLG